MGAGGRGKAEGGRGMGDWKSPATASRGRFDGVCTTLAVSQDDAGRGIYGAMFPRDLELYGPQSHATKPLSPRPKPPLLPAAGPPPLRELHRRQLLAPLAAAAAFLQHLRLLPLGRRPGRRAGRPATKPGPAGLVGATPARLLPRPDGPPGLHRPGRHHPQVRHSPRTRSSICWWPFARTSGCGVTKTSASC